MTSDLLKHLIRQKLRLYESVSKNPNYELFFFAIVQAGMILWEWSHLEPGFDLVDAAQEVAKEYGLDLRSNAEGSLAGQERGSDGQ